MTQSKVYSKDHPMHVVVCFSENASAIQFLKDDDPDWRGFYTIVAAFTYKQNAPGISFFTERDIPCHWLDWATFQSRDRLHKKDGYFLQLAQDIESYHPDYIVLSGFMLILPDWFIQKFAQKIINVHPADLSIVNEFGVRAYSGRGCDAIQKTMDGEMNTIRSTVHFVEEGPVDSGVIIAQSRPCKITPTDTAQIVQNRLKRVADGEALEVALKILRTKSALESPAIGFDWFKRFLRALSQ